MAVRLPVAFPYHTARTIATHKIVRGAHARITISSPSSTKHLRSGLLELARSLQDRDQPFIISMGTGQPSLHIHTRLLAFITTGPSLLTEEVPLSQQSIE